MRRDTDVGLNTKIPGTGQLHRLIRGISKGKVHRRLLAMGNHVRFAGSTHRLMLLRSERLELYAASAPDRLAQALVNLLTDVGADQRFREVPKLLTDWMLV
jgi:hypothetical protein